jgi:glutathione S-transferase
MALKLVIGNKNYSSWSMRPGLALRANTIPFDEVFIPLYTGEADKKRILSFTHSGKVPALIDGDVTVWDSLAIMEYVAERFPQTRLWPEDPARRAHARSISARGATTSRTARLCVALLQLEDADEVWAHVGGAGDGGVKQFVLPLRVRCGIAHLGKFCGGDRSRSKSSFL